jgi:hypothetical protein
MTRLSQARKNGAILRDKSFGTIHEENRGYVFVTLLSF